MDEKLKMADLHFYSQELLKTEKYPPEAIIQLAEEAVLQFPTFALGYKAKAYALLQLNKIEDAVKCLFLSLRYNKEDFQTFLLLGHCFALLKNYEEAILILKESIRLYPAQETAYAALANVLWCAFGEFDEILKNIQNALLFNENQADVLNLLRQMFKTQKEYDEMLEKIKIYNRTPLRKTQKIKWEVENEKSFILKKEMLEKALLLFPKEAEFYFKMANVLHQLGENHQAAIYCEKAIEFNQNNEEAMAYENARFIYYPYTLISKEKMGEFAQDYFKKYPLHPLWTFKNKRIKKRLKIGFVSADLRHHAVTKFLKNLLHNLKSSALDFYAYSTKDVFDSVSNTLTPYFRRWQNIAIFNDETAARFIHNDQIDILFDLSGMTVGNRLNIFRYRPAPIGITYLGWLGGVGTPGIDYILTDKVLSAHPNFQQEFTEKAFCLPDSWTCFSPPENISFIIQPTSLLNKGIMTFGAFHNTNKATQETLDLWAAVLNQIPDSHFIYMRGCFKDKLLQEHFFNQFKKRGVLNCENRVFLKHNENEEEYYQTIQNVDLILDTFPATGGTTTAEALFFGVPVLTLTGELMASKISASYLTLLELNEYIAQNKEDYILKAQNFAKHFKNHPQALNDFRLHLKEKFLHSSLCDGARFARHFEEACFAIYRAFEKGEYPR